jgi:hypothetical protein
MGLLKTGLKAVVAVKTADVIHQRVLQRQAAQGAQPHGHPAQAGGSRGSSEGVVEQLSRLGDLRASGVLTDAEFEAGKARILAG